MPSLKLSPHRYGQFIISIGGLGGLLYGIDIGIISAALLYLGKTVNLSVALTSIIVAAVLGGSMISSVIAGFLADWIGRRKMMTLAGLMFLTSVSIIFVSQSFLVLFLGRLLQGMSGGVIAVVIPLYLAECLSPAIRGRGTASDSTTYSTVSSGEKARPLGERSSAATSRRPSGASRYRYVGSSGSAR